MNYNRVKAH